jgi:hypothetical protein
VIDRAGQLYEARAEVSAALAVADLVFDLPERLVDPLQRRRQRAEGLRCRDRCVARRGQRRQLGAHVGQLLQRGEPLGLDLEDGDLVDQLTRPDGDVQVHGAP